MRRLPLRPLLYSLLLPLPLSVALCCAPTKAHAQAMRAADPGPVGKTTHFTLDKDEQKDLAITLAPGKYYIQADLKRVDDHSSNIFANIDLLKSNGSVVQTGILNANEVHTIARVGNTFIVAKPLTARLRIKGQEMPLEYWITVQPAARKTFVPFGFAHGELKPLGIGTENGKGGTLEGGEWAFHTIKQLPAGKYNVSLYMKQADGVRTNLMGKLVMLDAYGAESKTPSFSINMNEVDVESRKEQKLVLLKPQTLIFSVTNTNSKGAEYTIGIEKATD